MISQLRCRLQGLTWIALFAIFGLACAPTISHVLASASGQSVYSEICTPQGVRSVALDDQGVPPSGLGTHLQHCPLCGLSAVPLQAAGLVRVALLDVRFAQPAAAAAPPPRPQRAWASAQPRAPPLQG